MNDVMKNVTKILFWILALAVIVWTSSLTVSLASRLFPGDEILPYFVLALYDGGALIWLLVFLKNAKGLPQRAVALLAFALDCLGVMLASFSELFLGGQALTQVPEGLGTWVVWAVGISTIINLVSIYAYHITNPDELLEIKMQTMEDNVQNEAMRQVEARVTEQAALLAGAIEKRMYVNVLARLALPVPTEHQTMGGGSGNVIDGKARDAAVFASETQAAPEPSASSSTPVGYVDTRRDTIRDPAGAEGRVHVATASCSLCGWEEKVTKGTERDARAAGNATLRDHMATFHPADIGSGSNPTKAGSRKPR